MPGAPGLAVSVTSVPPQTVVLVGAMLTVGEGPKSEMVVPAEAAVHPALLLTLTV